MRRATRRATRLSLRAHVGNSLGPLSHITSPTTGKWPQNTTHTELFLACYRAPTFL